MAVEGRGGRGEGLESRCHRGILLLFPVDCITLTSAASWCSCTWENSRTPSGDFPAGWQKERVHNNSLYEGTMLEGQSELGGGKQTTSTSTKMKMSRSYSIASLNSKFPLESRSTKSKARRDADQNFRYYLILSAPFYHAAAMHADQFLSRTPF